MINLDNYRRRAIKAILQKLESLPNEVTVWDFKLDSLTRELYDLPARPTDDKPYVGWMSKPRSKDEDSSEKNCVPIKQCISQAGINLIKHWEGFRSKAYLCPANVWTIGYGHTKTATKGMCISEAQAEQLLKDDLRYFETQVSKLVKVKVNQNQFDALVSFTFNVGVGALAKSTLLRKLNGKVSTPVVANEFNKWVYANSKKLPGLVKRRAEERELFLS